MVLMWVLHTRILPMWNTQWTSENTALETRANASREYWPKLYSMPYIDIGHVAGYGVPTVHGISVCRLSGCTAIKDALVHIDLLPLPF